MKKLTYFEYQNKIEEHLTGEKLYSKYITDGDNPKNIGRILFMPKNSEGFSADLKLPKEKIVFYNHIVDEEASVLDDFMQTVSINSCFGFFVSPKLKDILSEYNLSSHRYYPLNIEFKDKLHPYYFLLISSENNGVNYPKSKFVDWYDDEKIIPIESFNDMLEEKIGSETKRKYWAVKEIEETRVVFNESIDIYPSPTIGSSFYFSERLKERLEKEGVTGMWLHPTDTPEFYLNDE